MKLHSISDKYRLQYVQDYRFPRFLMNFNENTHTCTCQRSKLEIDIRGKIEKKSIDTIYFLVACVLKHEAMGRVNTVNFIFIR